MTPQIQPIAEVVRTYVPPKTVIGSLSAKAAEYLTKTRGLSLNTLGAFKVGCTEKGAIAIPFFDENDVRQMVKFRHAEGGMLKLHGKETKTFTEPGGKGVLLGSHLCMPSEGPLILCFGDYDAMSIYEAGIPNATSLPLGDSAHDFIKFQWDFLEQFKEIVIFNDADEYHSDKARITAMQNLANLIQRLGKHRCKIVQAADRHGCKDANALLVKHGKEACLKAIENADWVPEEGLIKLADHEDLALEHGQPTGYSEIDRNTGGFSRGQLVLIGGDNGTGKTTVALNLIAKAIDQRVSVMFWSGEQRPGKIRYWFERVAAGPQYLKTVPDHATGFNRFFPYDENKIRIKSWYRDYLFQYTNFSPTKEQYFEVAELAIRRYGVGIIVIDNLMAFTGGEGDSYYQAQGDFAQSCKMFAEMWGVIVILIVHNKKTHQRETEAQKIHFPTKDDVEGSKKITNWADVILQMYRIPAHLRFGQWEDIDGVINLCKCRESGMLGVTPIRIDLPSNRISQASDNGHVLKYGWETVPQELFAR
jgi:KaiC/GvpD/RAD55 family RecA-like ATPase